MYHKIEDGAIFIADSHFNEKRGELLLFLQKLEAKEIVCKQLFLMGDMIDFISSESTYFIKRSSEVISILNKLSKEIEIFYFEGNHDYNLKPIFPNINVYKRENQPIVFKYMNSDIAISHGDIYTNDNFYEKYCKVVRNHYFLVFMNLIDIKNIISKKIYYSLLDKNICRKIDHFEEIVKKRVSNYSEDFIIEGHFHQGSEFQIDKKRYKNIQSLTCSKEYVIFKNNKFLGVSID